MTGKNLFACLLTHVGHFLSLLFGRVSWQMPAWLSSMTNRVVRFCKTWPRLILSSVAILIILAGSYYWYQQLPKPIQTVATITAPDITPLDDKGQLGDPQPVVIKFSRGDDKDISVAPLSAVGKTVTTGISLSPAMPGKWQWDSDSQLTFTPAQDWPAGQTYQVKFDKKLFAQHIQLAKYQDTFSTADFAVNIAEFKFYQDLKNPRQTQVIATLNFNFPVDSKSLEQRIHVVLQELKNDEVNLKAQSYTFTLSYDEHKRVAYLSSEDVPLSTAPRYIQLVIDKGVQAAGNGAKTTDSSSDKVLVPDESSFLQISSVDAAIVRDGQDRPQQVLNLETSLGVSQKELQKRIHVYRLPTDLPATATEAAVKNYAWQDPGEVTDDILALSQPVALNALPEEHDFPTLHSWQFSATTPGFLYVKVDKGVRGFGNFSLSDDYQTVVATPALPQEINFLHQGALISLSGEKKLTVLVRGVPLVKFSISRVLPNELNHLVSQAQGDFQNPNLLYGSFTNDDLSELFVEKRNFQMSSPSDLQYTTLDLQQYLKKAGQSPPLGLFLIRAQAWDAKTDQPSVPIANTTAQSSDDSDANNGTDNATPVENNRLILITDMGLLVKNNADKTHDLFVQSISNGTPVAGAQVALLGRNGLPIFTGTTQTDGHVKLPSVEDFNNERNPTVYVVRNGDDVSFMPYNRSDRQLNFSRFDVDGVTAEDVDNGLSAFIFSERGIYRPGDTIHLGMIVKQKFATALPAGLPLEVTITDPRGNEVLDQKLSLPASGLMSLDYQPDSTAPTGSYATELYLIKDGQRDSSLGSASVRVEEFLPDRLTARAQFVQGTAAKPLQSNGWVSPNDLNASIQVNNLYGTPATERRVTAKIILAPRDLSFPQYAAYKFVDPLLDPDQPPKVLSEDLSDANTDNKGYAQFPLNLQRFAKATYRLTFFTESFEADGGRGVSTQISTLVTPLDYLIGYKPDADLKYLKQNSQHAVNFIGINSTLQKIAVNDLQVQLLSVQTVATLVKNKDGTYAYQSVRQEKSQWQKPFALSEQGNDFILPTQDIGDYALVIKNKQGDNVSKLYFSVVGQSGHTVQKNAELAVKLDKASYNPGDTIEMQITAPYRGAGLITIERDKVYAYQWFKADDTSSVQTIKLPADFQGNGYINISFVRDWDSDEIFISPLSYSVTPFSVNNAASTVQLKLNAPSLVKPGQPVQIAYSSHVPAKIIVFAVDQGILQVTHYALPDPLAYFFRKYALTVDTAQIVDQILPKYISSRERSAVGGDDANKALANNLNPFKRKTEAPIVYWSGILDSDTTARTVTYNVPDYFNGTLRIMAVAVADNAVGNAQKDTLVRGDFVISPNVPTFVAPGDQFTVTANIANNIKSDHASTPSSVTLEVSDGLKVIGAVEQSLLIPAGEERSVQFNVEAKAVLGNASLVFHAKQGKHAAQYTSTLSIRPTSAYQTTLVSGSDPSSKKKVAITRQLYAEHRIQQAIASTNPLILAQGLQGYLKTYPYNCTEQLVSSALAQLAIAKQPLFNTDTQQTQQQLAGIYQILAQRQNSSNGFSYWPGSDDNASSQFATVYAMDFLTEAKAQGYAVPDNLFNGGISYLKNRVKNDPSDSNQARLYAYAIYVLTRNEIVTSSYLTNLQLYLTQQDNNDWKQDLTSVYLAATYHLLKNDKEAERLIRGYTFEKENSSIDRDSFTNALADNAQYVTLLARHFPQRLQKMGSAPIVALVAGLNDEEQVNTASAAYAATALSAYAEQLSDSSDNLSISEILTNKQTRLLPSLNTRYQQSEFSDQARSILFGNPDEHVYFYQVLQSGFDNKPVTQAINKNIEVYREYQDDKGNVINQVKLGDQVQTHIKVRALTDQFYSNVAIVDLLPGGFDVIPGSIKSDGCDYADVREDRVIFYCPVNATALELTYNLRAVNKGSYATPSILAQDMYRHGVQSVGAIGKIAVQ